VAVGVLVGATVGALVMSVHSRSAICEGERLSHWLEVQIMKLPHDRSDEVVGAACSNCVL
jgi:hypothetical protein